MALASTLVRVLVDGPDAKIEFIDHIERLHDFSGDLLHGAAKCTERCDCFVVTVPVDVERGRVDHDALFGDGIGCDELSSYVVNAAWDDFPQNVPRVLLADQSKAFKCFQCMVELDFLGHECLRVEHSALLWVAVGGDKIGHQTEWPKPGRWPCDGSEHR